jgi:phosphate transport system substrate-binding protein
MDRVVSLIADLNIPEDKIMLFGFSDSTGDYDSNLVLSLSRAQVVERQLILRGLKPSIVHGFGSNLAVASNDSDEGQARNRRVEVWIRR